MSPGPWSALFTCIAFIKHLFQNAFYWALWMPGQAWMHTERPYRCWLTATCFARDFEGFPDSRRAYEVADSARPERGRRQSTRQRALQTPRGRTLTLASDGYSESTNSGILTSV